MKLESFRNLLQLYFRFHGPFSEEVEKVLLKIDSLDWSSCETFEVLQILNTLATLYIIRGEVNRARTFIKEAIQITNKNSEYFIYTLANLFLISKFQGKEKRAKTFLFRAVNLARSGKNFLAIRQINNDIEHLKRCRADDLT